MSHLLKLTLIFCFSIWLTACGSGGDDPPPPSTEAVWDQSNWDEKNWQ